MAKSTTKLTDLQEAEWTRAIQMAAGGAALLVVAALLIYFGKQAMLPYPMLGWLLLFLATAGLVSGAALLFMAGSRFFRVRRMHTILFPCPYCGVENHFLTPPTQDFPCENCHRDVHFLNGKPVPVQKIICQACRAEHLVAISVERYLCDRCNRPLRIDGKLSPQAIVAGIDSKSEKAAAQPNQDVILIGHDPRKIEELSFRLQDLLLVNAPEARRLLHTASKDVPLIVGQNLPSLKAEAVSRQLRELGASVTLRQTTVGGRAPQKTR